jgi:colicin import membrane protein
MAGKSKAKAAPVEQEEDNSPMSTEIVTVAQPTALEAFGDPKKLEKMKADIGRALAEVVPANLDMAKPADRKTLKSIAAKIPKLKTKMDAWGSESVEDLRAQISSVDAARKDLREFLDEKRTEIRKPLTEWEDAEEARLTKIKEELERIRVLGQVAFGASVADISAKVPMRR